MELFGNRRSASTEEREQQAEFGSAPIFGEKPALTDGHSAPSRTEDFSPNE